MRTITVKDGMTIWARLLHLRRARRRPFGATMLHDRHGDGRRQVGDHGSI
jgi:hypothetical protein